LIKYCLVFLFFCGLYVPLKAQSDFSDSIRLNDIRFIASHNSYKKRPDPKVLGFLTKFKKRLGEDMDPKRMDYGHLTLTEQFTDYHVRGIELDVYYDPKGGKFRKRRLNFFIAGLKQRTKDSVLRQPGFKLLHIADIDYETHYLTFTDALSEIKTWSDAHPDHTPLFINIEPKGDSPGDYSSFLRFIGFRKALKFDSCAYDALDEEIWSIFTDKQQVLRPADLKGTYTTIGERLRSERWPLLNQCLGKVIFIVDGDRGGRYQAFLEKGEDRPMFVYSEPDSETTAFVKRNDPIGQEEAIKALSELYIVRTRTDVETIQARNNDYRMFNSAIESQAQILSTDFYKADERFSTFQVSLENLKNGLEQTFILRRTGH
jgi:hypothetical protein